MIINPLWPSSASSVNIVRTTCSITCCWDAVIMPLSLSSFYSSCPCIQTLSSSPFGTGGLLSPQLGTDVMLVAGLLRGIASISNINLDTFCRIRFFFSFSLWPFLLHLFSFWDISFVFSSLSLSLFDYDLIISSLPSDLTWMDRSTWRGVGGDNGSTSCTRLYIAYLGPGNPQSDGLFQ